MEELTSQVSLGMADILSTKETGVIEKKFTQAIGILLNKHFPDADEKTNSWKIPAGQSKGFTFNARLDQTNGTANLFTKLNSTSFVWSLDDTVGSDTTFDFGIDIFTVTDINGCSASISGTVNEPAALAATTSMVPTTCSNCNGIATINTTTGGTAPFTYLWANGDVSSTSSALCAITQNVTITDNNGCVLPLSISVTDLPAPSLVITATEPNCNGESSGTATAVTIPGGGAIVSWQWDDLNNQIGPTAVNLPASTYQVTVTDINGCTATNIIILDEPAPFLLFVRGIDISLCAGNSTQVYATPSGGVTPYGPFNWNAASSPYADSTTTIFTVTPQPGTTTFYGLNMVDANGCFAQDSVGITTSPALGLDVPGTLEMCIGNNENICVTGYGGQAIDYWFYWSTGDSSHVPGVVTSCINVTPTATGQYSVIIWDGCSAPLYDTINVIIHPLPPIDVNSDVFQGCPPFTPIFGVNIGTEFPGASINLDVNFDGSFDYSGPVDSLDSDNAYYTSYQHTFEDPGTYTLFAQVTSAFGCVNQTTLDNYIEVFPDPEAAFSYDPQELSLLDPTVTVNGSPTLGISDPDNMMHWNFGDGSTADGLIAQNTYADTGIYTVLLIVENEYGCFDTATVDLVVAPEYMLYTPNAFTPTGDGLNDEFFPKGVGINPDDFVFRIYDRWGEIIFESARLDDWWDGTARSKGGTEIVQTGVYIWQIETSEIGKPDRKHKHIGHVTLLK